MEETEWQNVFMVECRQLWTWRNKVIFDKDFSPSWLGKFSNTRDGIGVSIFRTPTGKVLS